MVYPGPPPEAPEPRRQWPDDRRGVAEDDFDDLDISNIRKKPPSEGDLTTGDWLLCIFCSGIACIIGIVRLMQGKPGAGKMIGVAILFSFLWSFVRLMFEAMSHR